jgi:hypothetical protein
MFMNTYICIHTKEHAYIHIHAYIQGGEYHVTSENMAEMDINTIGMPR